MSMKSKLKNIKKLKEEFSEFSSILNKIQKEHEKILLEQKNELISNIAYGEGLDEISLRDKYLKVVEKEKTKKKEAKNSVLTNDSLLDKVILNDETYFYENKENGNIYNSSSEKVGTYTKKQFVFS